MRFGSYTVLDKLKQRGPVITCRAREDTSGQLVILKMLQKDAVTPERVAALRHEYALIRDIDSPRVVKEVDIVWEDDCPALVLEDIGGTVLADRLVGEPMPMTEALRIAIGMAEALEAVHGADIMHGDINPSNLLVGDTPDQVTLIDFGFSERGGVPAREGAGLRGSPNYIAPELTGRVAQGADGRADLYSFGALLYQMLSGQLPFNAGDLLKMVYAHMALQPRPLGDLVPTVPEVVSDLVARLMAKRPEQRYQTAAGLAADLRHCLALVEGAPVEPGYELGRQDIPRKLAVSSNLQGRDGETQKLRRAFDRVRAGNPAGLSLEITGPAGAGKTTLINSALAYVDRNGGLFVTGQVDAGGTEDPLGGMAEAARRIAELLLTERYGTLEEWAERLRGGMGDLLPALAEWLPELAALVGTTEPAPHLEPRESAERLAQALRRFFRVCGMGAQPLVLVLENLHAADRSALALLDGLARPEGAEHLLLIVSRRTDPAADPSKDAAGPLQVDETIDLAGLKPAAVARLLAETFRRDVEACAPLADAIIAKAGDTPLAIGQFLGALVDDGIVHFDSDTNSWAWDLPAVVARDTSEGVVGILVARGAKMTAEERATIGAAAAVGRTFTLAEAETASPAAPEDVTKHLERAVSMGWIAPAGDLSGETRTPAMRFLHDRIWDAADAMLSDEERHAAHTRLAGFYMAQAGGGLPEGELLFTAARHLGASLSDDTPSDVVAKARGVIAAAGGAAMAAGDLKRSHFHFNKAAELLGPDDYAQQPQESLGIVGAAAAAALLAGNFDAMQIWHDIFLEFCPDPAARARIKTLDLFANLAQNRAKEAVGIGAAAMADLGDPINDNPGPGDIEAEVGAVFAALEGRPIEAILNLPEVNDPICAAGHEVLAATLFPAFSANPLAFAVVAARLTARSIREGISPSSVEGFNGFGIMACGPMNQIDLGYGISQMARQLVEQKGLYGARARSETIWNAFIRHRKEPIRDTLGGLIQARDIGLSSGDIQSAGLASFDHAFQLFWIGDSLESTENVLREAAAFCGDLKVGIYPDLIGMYLQTCNALRDGPATRKRLKADIAGRAGLAETYHHRRDVNGLSQLHILQMLQAHVFGEHETALAEGRQAMQFLEGITSTPAVPAFHAMFAMIATPQAGGAPDPQDVAILVAGRELTALWAEHAPQNYRHYALITQAEAALAQGDESAWLEGMEAAADHATQQVFKRDAALILERIAMVSQARGRQRRFSHFLRDAWRAWVHYGADAKVAALSHTHGALVEATVTTEEEIDNSLSISVHDEQLDLGALLKATRAISQEVQLADLLSALLAGIVETAGADHAVVLAPDKSQFRIVAELAAGLDGPVYASAPDIASGRICGEEDAPLSALKLVARLQTPLSTSDVAGDPRLSGDPFLRDTPPKAMAIIPMINGRRLLGLVYLENREIADAFSAMRMNLLTALCAQAAVSWDNANLYDRQSHLLDAADRFVPAELSRLFDRDSIADVKLTDARAGRMTLMVSDLRGSTSQAEQLGATQTFSQINAFLSGFSKTVRDHGGFVLKYVGDGVLAVFPEGPARAMDAAISYQEKLTHRNWDPSVAGALKVGIAIHSGEVMFGVVGDETRMQIDALSDAVNVVFRLEAMTKRLGARVLVSDAALNDVAKEDQGRHHCRFLGEVETQGRRSREAIHELLDAEPEELRNAKLQTLTLFEEGVRRFGDDDFVNACVHLGSVLRDSPADAAASHLFQEAAKRMGTSGIT